MKKVVIICFLLLNIALQSNEKSIEEIEIHGYIEAQNVRIRRKPDINSDVIGICKQGYETFFTEKTINEYKLGKDSYPWYYNGEGWIYGKFIKFDKSFDYSKIIKTIPPFKNPLLYNAVGIYRPLPVLGMKDTLISPDIGFDIYNNVFLKVEFNNYQLYRIVKYEDSFNFFTLHGELLCDNYKIHSTESVSKIVSFTFLRSNKRYGHEEKWDIKEVFEVDGEYFFRHRLNNKE